MRVAIVGSRGYRYMHLVRDFVASLPAGAVVVSGGALGVDSVAAQAAEACGLEVVIHHADWARRGRRAGPERNARMVADADEVVAFWDGSSRGTADTISRARAAGKPLRVIGDGVVG